VVEGVGLRDAVAVVDGNPERETVGVVEGGTLPDAELVVEGVMVGVPLAVVVGGPLGDTVDVVDGEADNEVVEVVVGVQLGDNEGEVDNEALREVDEVGEGEVLGVVDAFAEGLGLAGADFEVDAVPVPDPVVDSDARAVGDARLEGLVVVVAVADRIALGDVEGVVLGAAGVPEACAEAAADGLATREAVGDSAAGDGLAPPGPAWAVEVGVEEPTLPGDGLSLGSGPAPEPTGTPEGAPPGEVPEAGDPVGSGCPPVPAAGLPEGDSEAGTLPVPAVAAAAEEAAGLGPAPSARSTVGG
jgi:hypothetical protein